MSLQTGGRAVGATSTRSRSASCASRRASSIRTMPTVSPLGPTRRTSGTRIRSLIRSSVLMCPPGLSSGATGSAAAGQRKRPPPHLRSGSQPSAVHAQHHSRPNRRRATGAGPRTGPDDLSDRDPGGRCGWETCLRLSDRACHNLRGAPDVPVRSGVETMTCRSVGPEDSNSRPCDAHWRRPGAA